jgi:hypothetical protein
MSAEELKLLFAELDELIAKHGGWRVNPASE